MLETRWARPVEAVIAAACRPDARLSDGEHPLGDGDFLAEKSLAELARTQGVSPIKNLKVFAGVIPDDEDVDEMLAKIYRLREP